MVFPKELHFSVSSFLNERTAGRFLVRYAKGENIFTQGESADAVYYNQKGQIKISVGSSQGKDAVVALLNPGEFFGEGCLAGQTARTSTAVAMSACELHWVERSMFVQLLGESPAFSESFLSHMLHRAIRVEEDLVDQLFNSSEKRLARALLLLANVGKEDRPEAVIAKVSQATLAEMIGTTRSRVSFFMNKFRRLGFISYSDTLMVHPSLLSVVRYEQPEKPLRVRPAPKDSGRRLT